MKESLSPPRKKLRGLVHRRDQILSQSTAERKRLLQTYNEGIAASIKEAIAFYKNQLQLIDMQIAETIESCEELRQDAALMQSWPDGGIATVAMFLSELPELGSLNRGQVAKLVGVALLVRESGAKEGKRKTFAGRSMIRKVLYMSALVATRFNARMKSFYQSLFSRGKPRKLALVAVMRKLLVTLNTMLKNKENWRETPLAIEKLGNSRCPFCPLKKLTLNRYSNLPKISVRQLNSYVYVLLGDFVRL